MQLCTSHRFGLSSRCWENEFVKIRPFRLFFNNI